MLRNKVVVYVSFHPSKSDVKAHGILLFRITCVLCGKHSKMCFHGAAILHSSVRLVHMIGHCENMYDVQLSSQILFSQLNVRPSKSFGAAVELFIIVGHIQYVWH